MRQVNGIWVLQTFTLAMVLQSAPADAKIGLDIGLKGAMGLNNAALESRDLTDRDNFLNADTNVRMGYALGLEVDLHFINARWFGLAADLSPALMTKGYVMPGYEQLPTFEKDQRLVTLSYLHIPLYAKVRILPWFFIAAGAYLDFLLSTKTGWTEALLTRSAGEINMEKNPALRKVGAGLALKVGAQITLFKRIIPFVEFGYQMGLTNIRESEKNPTGETITLRSLTIALGLRFAVLK